MKRRLAATAGITILALGVAVGAAFAAKGGAFEGTWKGVDRFDGSNQWMWIENFSGVHEILYYDDVSSWCMAAEFVPAAVGVWSARVTNVDQLTIDGGVVTCMWLNDFQLLPVDPVSFAANPDGSLTDTYENIWVRGFDRPARVIKPPPVPKPTPTPGSCEPLC